MIQPTYMNLRNLFATRLFEIPLYQRLYSWTKRQRDDLFNDLTKLHDAPADQHHFMATIVCYNTGGITDVGATQYQRFEIVDGQQRLTTLILLLKCIELILPNEFPARREVTDLLVKQDARVIILQANNANHDHLSTFLRTGNVPLANQLTTHGDRQLADGISGCKKFVSDWISKKRDISQLLRIILNRLGFVVFDVNDARIVYTVFEVLNSRGLPVDWLDKTKTALMGVTYEHLKGGVTAAEALKELQATWGRLYAEIAKENVPGDEIIRTAATLRLGGGGGRPLSAQDSLDQIRDVTENKTYSPQEFSNWLLATAEKLTEFYSSSHLNAVTEVLHARILGVAIQLSDYSLRDKAALIDQWERTTFRIFGLMGKDARTKVGDYVRVAVEVAKGKASFSKAMEMIRRIGADYPIDLALREGVIGKDFYSRPEECRYFLWNYEEHLAKEAGGHVDEQDRSMIWRQRADDSLEHIFPKAPFVNGWYEKLEGHPVETVVNRVGNLVLLTQALNLDAGRLPFGGEGENNKRAIYMRQGTRMTREVAREPDWTIEAIESREQRLVEWARNRWADVENG